MWAALCLVFALLAGEGTPAEPIEVFDTDQGRVVDKLENSPAFQEEAARILHSVTGRVLEISPQLEPAVIVKIPLSPPRHLSVPREKLEADVTQMFVVMPKGGRRLPWLILNTKEGQSLLVEFSRSTDTLARLLRHR